MKKIFIALFTLFIFLNTSLYAQNESLADSSKNNIIIKLVTIGPGHDLTSWWGHTAIVVEEKTKLESKFYNYGLFSFQDDNFVLNFIMGRLIFWVGAWKTPNALAYYRGLDRNIRFQTLNLTENESIEIKDFLENNVKPENARYLYDHYYDNCSTRLRDIFNRTSNGKLSEIAKEKSRMTLREHTRRHTYRNPIMDFILMFLMNDTIDKPITVWDDMFLPTEMEMVMDKLEYISPEGELKKIVISKLIYYESQSVPVLPQRAPLHWPYTLIIGIVLGVISLFFIYFDNSKMLIIYHMLIGFIFGFIGTLLFLISTITDHTVTYFNENLFFANPLTFIIFPMTILVLKNREKYINIFYFNWMILVIIALLGIFLKILPAFDQDSLQTMTLILPVLIGSFISTYILKNRDST